MSLKMTLYREYVLEECKRQWAECQEKDGYGAWADQAGDVQREYYEGMYQHLWNDRENLDAVLLPNHPENDAWQKLNSRMKSELRVETPLGSILVIASTDTLHPGVWIDLRRPDSDVDMPLALVEFSDDDCDLPPGEPHIITRIWGDGAQEDYTERVVHKEIETFFEKQVSDT